MEIISSFTTRYTLYRTWQCFFLSLCFNLLLFLFFVSCVFSFSILRSPQVAFFAVFVVVVASFFSPKKKYFEAWRECANARYQLHCRENLLDPSFLITVHRSLFARFSCCLLHFLTVGSLHQQTNTLTQTRTHTQKHLKRLWIPSRWPFHRISIFVVLRANINKQPIPIQKKKLTLYTIK